MAVEDLINIQQAMRILKISKRALHQRIKVGYYGAQRVGTVLLDPATGEPLTPRKLKLISIRSRGRQPGKYGHYSKKKRTPSRAATRAR